MKTKEVEQLVGISSTNLRFYEREHLVEPQRNEVNNYREYSDEDIERLKQIKMLRMIGVSIPEIKELLKGKEGLKTVIEKRLAEIQKEEAELSASRKVCENILESNTTMGMLTEELFSENTEIWNEKLEMMQLKERAEKMRWLTSVILSGAIIFLSFITISWAGMPYGMTEQIAIIHEAGYYELVWAGLTLHFLVAVIYIIGLIDMIMGKHFPEKREYYSFFCRFVTILELYCLVWTPWLLVRHVLIEWEAVNTNSGNEFWEVMLKKKK